MRYTGLELFMEKLKHMSNPIDNPVTSNHPLILSQRHQFQLVYKELASTIRTLFTDEDHELQQLTNLRKRFKDAAEDAHDIIDLFVFTVNRLPSSGQDRDQENFHLVPEKVTLKEKIAYLAYVLCGGYRLPIKQFLLKEKVSTNLEDVMRSIKSIKEEFITIRNNLKMDSLPRSDPMNTPVTAAAGGTSSPKSPLGTMKSSQDIVVGLDRHAVVIRDKLVDDQKQLDVVSIVGMGGLGKTTLATKIFNDPFVIYHFHVRGWVTISQTYEKEYVLIQILESIGIKPNNVRGHDYSKLRQMLRQKLMGKRYLIVIDDIWNTNAWDVLKLSFPNDHTGSRILLTSRFKEVALHAKLNGFIHQLEYLTEEESWELLCKKVFHGSNQCPKWLIEPGMHIAKNCHGLPLTLVVVAGVLAKEALSKDSWKRIGRSVSSYLVKDQTHHIHQLALSFDHLPSHLRDCFLYLGGFPEDHMFRVQRLIWLWMAEGFIQEDGHRSLEEIAEDHLMELVDRNLVVVADRKSDGRIKAFYVHDLLRELCLEIAMKENFYLKAQRTTHSITAYKQRRLFIEDIIIITNAPRIRSLVCVGRFNDTRKLISKYIHSLMLVMVLDLRYGELEYFPEEISRLVHLRYLAISYNGDIELPSSICNLSSLQTLIISRYVNALELPNTISNLVNLRHLILEERSSYIIFPAIQKPMNLQTISRVELGREAESWVNCFQGIKKLSCNVRTYKEFDFGSLTSLENLKLSANRYIRRELKFTRFPPSLHSLTLDNCYLHWSDMSIIQSLPNLEALKLRYNSFVGPRWDVGEEPFRQLKVLKLHHLDLRELEASSINFPCLKQLLVKLCRELEEIPPDFGNIPTLELINIAYCKHSVVESLETIKEEQHAQGNFDLKISVKNCS